MNYSPTRKLLEHVRAHLALKVTLVVALTTWFCLMYFGIQRVHLFPQRAAPTMWLDTNVPFRPAWAWAYQSVYLLMTILTWITARRADLWRFVRAFTLLSGVCFVLFLIMPVAGPEQPAAPAHGAYTFVVSYTGRLNAFPSLHAGFAMLVVLHGHRLLRGQMRRSWATAYALSSAVWIGLILYATMATRMHWFVDLPAGLVLAWLSHWWVWRRVDASTVVLPAQPSPQNHLPDTGE